MQIRPILSSLMRHKTAALLIVFEITLSCAIICNAIFIIGGRVAHMQASSGVAEDEVVYISTSSVAADGRVLLHDDLAALQAIPGVTSVSDVNQIPYGDTSWAGSASLPGDETGAEWPVSVYLDEQPMTSISQQVDVRMIDIRPAQPCLLEHVLCIRRRSEHLVCDGEQHGAMLGEDRRRIERELRLTHAAARTVRRSPG